MTAHRCAGGLNKKMGLRSGLRRDILSVEFFNVPVQIPTRGQPFYGYIPHFSRFNDAHGDTEDQFSPGPRGGGGGNSVRKGEQLFSNLMLARRARMFIFYKEYVAVASEGDLNVFESIDTFSPI